MKYTVQPGDSLSKIALKFYGSAGLYDRLLQANPQIENEDLITIGQVIEVPGIGTQDVSTSSSSNVETIVDEEKPEMTKTVLIIFALSAAALGYMVMKNMAKKGGPLSGAAEAKNPRRRRRKSKRPEDFVEIEEEIEEE